MSPTVIGLILFGIFVVFAALMYTGKLPALIALPLMAAALFLVGGAFYYKVSFQYPNSHALQLLKEFMRVVIEEGMPRLWTYIITVVLGATLAEILKESGVSKTIIRWASELGGDNKAVMCILLTMATALLFSSLVGLGSVIMVASIVLPILISIGVSPAAAGSLFLLGMSLGGAFNPVNWQFYIDIMSKSGGVPAAEAQNQLLRFVFPFSIVFLAVIVVFILLNARKGYSSFWAASAKSTKSKSKSGDAKPAGFFAVLTPLVPIVLVLGFNVGSRFIGCSGAGCKVYGSYLRCLMFGSGYMFPINTALLIGILYGLIATGRGPNGRIQKLTKSVFDAVSASAPVIAIIIGIGMIIRVVWDPAVGTYMEPLLKRVIPSSPILYVVVFTVLAPLALYRGPLNVWGMGIALGGIMIGTKVLPPVAVMCALYSVGMIQGVSDPTNTHNVWIAGFLGEDVQKFTKKTILFTWVLALFGLILAAAMYLH
jgi:TRAP-type C4-dicarboxylate transport system permease large subunit